MTQTVSSSRLPVHRSLRAKGLVATLALLAYLVVAGVYIAVERQGIYAHVQRLEQLAAHEKSLALTEAAVSSALIDVTEAGSAATIDSSVTSELALYMETCVRLFAALDHFDPGYAKLQRGIARSWDSLQASADRVHWIDLREALHRAADELDIRGRVLADQRGTLLADYQRQHDAVTVKSLLLATAGIVAFATLAAWFFSRLARDIGHLEAHARQIVLGRRGVILPVRRDDELGQLMHAVNRMATDLDEREQQIGLDAERRLHEEKMLAIGAMAAGVSHEVNNPLSVISGLAQELQGHDLPPGRVAESADLILAQVRRAALAARQIAEVSAPRPADLDWVDLRALVQDAVRMVGYDRRYRRLRFEVSADPALPALRSSASSLQQALAQLLSLVGNALMAQPDAPPEVHVQVATEDHGAGLCLLLAPVLDFMRPEVQRALLLTRAIVEPLGGRLALGQADDGRQRIKLCLPADTIGKIA